ncbi:hypothetical protein CVU5213_04305 [Campylobacter vulpis]|uniref:DUF3298 domain-containing protein n=1 Tax=Campylobacter vulpis TaxID=1655500 RepID=A0A2G4QYX0_9BACT|nr:hypothetical protein [Campylobacter vulpis]MBS4240950.1 hypothetical protein [Campylobacter vulpis]MBS4252863.1 hypothetical protein [Campylobacter vulpis]MBS4282150.1 hypothetical protein [Campylobacter vulpis]MBS4331325.1 hypothetical protein [Campylobacter vulpis]MBS4439812.1 hypothetical protein [Campylobacter vulpis]
MKRFILLAFVILMLRAEDGVLKYGFEFKDGVYHLVELKKEQKKLCLGKICSIEKIYAEGNYSFTSTYEGKVVNSYKNTLFFIPDEKLVLGNLENENLNKDLNSCSSKEVFHKLLQDKKHFLENEELNYYGNEISQNLKIAKITKDKIFFENFVDYSYSGAAHPSFYTSGFSLDTKTMELKTYLLSDVVEDSSKFRNFINKILKEYLTKNKEEWADWDERDYFGKDEFEFNILKQEVVFKERGLYINLRYLLSEAGRSMDFFEVPYENLKDFAKGDLKRILEK